MNNKNINMLFGAIVIFGLAAGVFIGFFDNGVRGACVGALIGVLVPISLYSFIEGVIKSEFDKGKAMESFSAFFAGMGISIGLLVGLVVVGDTIGAIVCVIISTLLSVSGCMLIESVVGYKDDKKKAIDSLGGALMVVGLAAGIGVGFFGVGGLVSTIVCSIIGVLVTVSIYVFIEGVIEAETDKNKAEEILGTAFVIFGSAVGIGVGFFVFGGIIPTIACIVFGIVVGVVYMLIGKAIVGEN